MIYRADMYVVAEKTYNVISVGLKGFQKSGILAGIVNNNHIFNIKTTVILFPHMTFLGLSF